jgi:hypothetical protein
MLQKMSNELAWQIIARLNLKDIDISFQQIQPLILRRLMKCYLTARQHYHDGVPLAWTNDGTFEIEHQASE